MSTPNPILITGSHRSGTTWVGRMIASSSQVTYIDEPFHIKHDPVICKARFEYWFTYICSENEKRYIHDLAATFALKYSILQKLLSARKAKHITNEIFEYRKAIRNRKARIRPLIKDPIALFSAEWLHRRFRTDNVVMIRHPAAFVGSLKAQNWTHDFSHFLKQPLLMQHHLHLFKKEITEFSKNEYDIIDQASLLWNLIHHMILRYRDSYPEWLFVRHEDLSRTPVEGFEAIFDKLNLEFTSTIAEVIRRHSSSVEARSQPTTHSDLMRDSYKNIATWKSRLTPEEVERVKNKVSNISQFFYSYEDW